MSNSNEPNIAIIANLIGDNARAKMLTALMGGKALTATELALEADISSQTASSHLAKLVEGQLLVVRKQGRHKYFQLQNASIAQLLETLLNISIDLPQARVKTGPNDLSLRQARICYDHLAGELGVKIYDALIKHKYIIDNGEQTVLTVLGQSYFESIGFDFIALKKSKRPLCKSCLDWSERRNHLAGTLGQWILNDMFDKNWAKRALDSRAINISSKGLKKITQTYKIKLKKHV
ncbi:ArsR/SmtB family transcription factor [Pseudoalteromonas denitrificans]|uniref:Transcriptional regulator, ArsR family n=1 Tax=Pseudoalteromonas denitrificans DSM 6059 TaxID=1123010 RepID=A0A1I1NKB7_9GAMM|nr:winged helix-turn-helix domain-containing protein [Pseudoalteromonas denitrificans]SFC98091.1 transcriptional regulator, ArsR family [Pseudoalteromonas denitrificans DSM 6059]